MQLDLPRSDPPSWLDEVRITSLSPEKAWSASSTLDLLSTGNELEGWLHDPRPYEGRHGAAWLSAIDDFMHCADQIGPELQRALDPELPGTVATAQSIRRDIESSKKNPGAIKTLLRARLPNDRVAYADFKRRWVEPAVRLAAWHDFLNACRDETTSYDTLALRRDLLTHVLADSRRYVDIARWQLGDINRDQLMSRSPHETAGLTERQRLTLCERLLAQAPRQAHHVVWLAFDRAGGSGTAVHQIGRIAFWDSRWLRGLVEQRSPDLQQLTPELLAADSMFNPAELPEDPEVILARVDLGIGAFTDPVRLAAEQAGSVVALASFHADAERWRSMSGYLDFADDRLAGASTFTPPEPFDDFAAPLYNEFLLAEVDRLAPRLEAHLPITDHRLSEVVQAVRWWQQARPLPSLAALLFDVRILELIAKRVGDDWPIYLQKYLRTTWVRLTIRGALVDVVQEALHSRGQLSSDAQRQRLEALKTHIISSITGGIMTDAGRCLDALPELAALFPVHSRLGRRLRTINGRLASAGSVIAWRDELDEEWARLTKRLQRLRNALTHGGPFHDEGVGSTHEFGKRLASWSLSFSLEGLLQGNDLPVAHSEHSQRAAIWWDNCRAASSVSEAVFGP